MGYISFVDKNTFKVKPVSNRASDDAFILALKTFYEDKNEVNFVPFNL